MTQYFNVMDTVKYTSHPEYGIGKIEYIDKKYQYCEVRFDKLLHAIPIHLLTKVQPNNTNVG
jgi:hypothetical protein